MQKNERITNIFARIARGEAEAILYHWVSNTFDTHIIKFERLDFCKIRIGEKWQKK